MKALLVAAALLLGACAKTVPDETSVRVSVKSDLGALDAVEIQALLLPEDKGAKPVTVPYSQPIFPVGFLLLPRDSASEQFRITVRGFIQDTVVVSFTLESKFIAGRRGQLVIRLDPSCRGMLCEAAAKQTCRDGACGDVPHVTVELVDKGDAGVPDARGDAAPDGAMSADAVSPDAASDSGSSDGPASDTGKPDVAAPDTGPPCTNACTVGTTCLSGVSLQTCAIAATGCTANTTATCGAETVCERAAPAACLDPNWAAWPMPNAAAEVNASSYKDNGDGTVTDNVTGLMWEKAPGATTYGWPAARTHCPQLTLGGHADWRLPTLIELVSLVDYTAIAPPVVKAGVFTTLDAALYWSATTSTSMINSAWEVNFFNGNTNADSITSSNPVICVR